VDLTAIEAANDAARTLAATLATLRRLQAENPGSPVADSTWALGRSAGGDRGLPPAPAPAFSSSPAREGVLGESAGNGG
jgi:hypothetical protein